MNISINPFQQQYFSDDTQVENNFVDLFSREVLQSAINPIFQGGNVILSGPQGCGKTMILNLLRPEVRIAYWDSGKPEQFPVSEGLRNFISCGINLTRCRITDLLQVTLGSEEDDSRELPLYFADFFNYLVVQDLIKSIETIGKRQDVFGAMVNTNQTEVFAGMIAVQDCWFGYLDGVRSLKELKQRVLDRISYYRRWVNGNEVGQVSSTLISSTKTNIGEPIAKAADCLRECGVIDGQLPVLIRVDQIEEMHRAFTERQRALLLTFRKMLNRAFASRDARIHYRAGTRRYGWSNPEFLGIWGSEARLENRRDYHLIEMDAQLFSYGEEKNSIFARFALDAFQKRVAYFYRSEVDPAALPLNLAKIIFGGHPSAEKRVEQLSLSVDDDQIDRALGLDLAADDGAWSIEWRDFLRGLYRQGHAGMIDAVLAAAWGRQTGGANIKKQHRELPPPCDDAPWRNRKWWRKERKDLAVLQLMTRCQQRFVWWGFDDVRSLSGGNITAFLHICHRVWDGFLKSESSKPEDRRVDLLGGKCSIDHNIQSSGILFASNEWFRKLPEEPGGNARQNFVEQLGMILNKSMLADLRMAYPGGNGISVSLADFESAEPDVSQMREFLREAVGYGALVEVEHTSKTKLGGRRLKFHLNPILCPRFQLPEARTKEPYYWSIDQLFLLLRRAKVTIRKSMRPSVQPKSDNRKDVSPMLPGLETTKE